MAEQRHLSAHLRRHRAAAAVTAAMLPGPFIRTAHAQTTVWKVQTSWPAGVGLQTFKDWCATIKEKTGGELEFKAFGAKEVVGDFELIDGVKNGVIEAMNSFTLYWAGKLPATAFLSSYLMGLRYPHEWDMFFYSKGGLQAARDIFAKQGLYYVNRIHHGPNIVHSKRPIRTIEDFKGLKLRVPGGMIAEGFAAIGARTTLLPGGEVFSALEKGTVDAADYVGPAVNWDLGFNQVTKYIWMGPPGLESVYQPVDLMDFIVNMNVWNRLSPKMKQWLDDEIQAASARPGGVSPAMSADQPVDRTSKRKHESSRMPAAPIQPTAAIPSRMWSVPVSRTCHTRSAVPSTTASAATIQRRAMTRSI
jgi:TRAP-type mannitol/chloroaromatic compound transport system substrate-binding protein